VSLRSTSSRSLCQYGGMDCFRLPPRMLSCRLPVCSITSSVWALEVWIQHWLEKGWCWPFNGHAEWLASSALCDFHRKPNEQQPACGAVSSMGAVHSFPVSLDTFDDDDDVKCAVAGRVLAGGCFYSVTSSRREFLLAINHKPISCIARSFVLRLLFVRV